MDSLVFVKGAYLKLVTKHEPVLDDVRSVLFPAVVCKWKDVLTAFHVSHDWHEIMLSWRTDHMVTRHLHVCLAHSCDGVHYPLETFLLKLQRLQCGCYIRVTLSIHLSIIAA